MPARPRVGTAMLYVLVASIGMGMDVMAVFTNPGLFAIGGIWIAFHASLMLIMARVLRVPTFYMAVASQGQRRGRGLGTRCRLGFPPQPGTGRRAARGARVRDRNLCGLDLRVGHEGHRDLMSALQWPDGGE